MWFVTQTGGRSYRRRSTRSAAEEGANAEDDRVGKGAARTEIFVGVGGWMRAHLGGGEFGQGGKARAGRERKKREEWEGWGACFVSLTCNGIAENRSVKMLAILYYYPSPPLGPSISLRASTVQCRSRHPDLMVSYRSTTSIAR